MKGAGFIRGKLFTTSWLLIGLCLTPPSWARESTDVATEQCLRHGACVPAWHYQSLVDRCMSVMDKGFESWLGQVPAYALYKVEVADTFVLNNETMKGKFIRITREFSMEKGTPNYVINSTTQFFCIYNGMHQLMMVDSMGLASTFADEFRNGVKPYLDQ